MRLIPRLSPRTSRATTSSHNGMARALFATVLAQALVAVIALTAGLGSTGPIWPWDILILTGFFTALWVGSAWLFRNAAREQPTAGAGQEG